LLTCGALVAVTAAMLMGLVNPRGPGGVVVGFGVAAFGLVVLAGEALSFIRAFNRVGLLGAHAAFFAVVAAAWRRRAGPTVERRIHLSVGSVRARPLIAFTVGMAALALLAQLLVGVAAAPNNWDSMTYHLSRAAYWLQQGAALRFDGASVRQLDSPPNAEIAVATTMALSGTDRYAHLAQWFSLLGCAAAIGGLARLLCFPRAASVAAAALFVVLPGPILQSLTTQNDLVVTACLLAAALLAASGFRERHTGTVALGGAALGLAVGTKGTALFALPSILVIVGAAAWSAAAPIRLLARYVAAAVLGTLAFGAFQYAQNWFETGSPFGAQPEVVGRSGFSVPANAARVLWSFVESPGISLPGSESLVRNVVGKVLAGAGDPGSLVHLGTEVNEDVVAAGLLGWMILWPLTVAVLVWPRVPSDRRAQAAAAVAYAVAVALLVRATPFNGRILIPAIGFAAPLLALAARHEWAVAIVSSLALTSLVPCLLVSESHPVLRSVERPAFFDRDRIGQMTVLRPDQAPVLRAVERSVAPDATLVWVGGTDSWDYPFFGERLSRRVVRVPGGDAPQDGKGMCPWLRERIRRAAAAAVVVLDAPREAPAPPPSIRASEPSAGNFIATARAVGAACPRITSPNGPGRPSRTTLARP
jgi:hypothetical protein